MGIKKFSKKLVLKKTTVANLEDKELNAIAAGGPSDHRYTNCIGDICIPDKWYTIPPFDPDCITLITC